MLKKVVLALAAGVVLTTTPVPPASAAESAPGQFAITGESLKGLGRTIKLAKKLYTYLETASKIATDDVPNLMSDNSELQQREQRARRFKVESQPPVAPKIEGDRVFSKDPETRAAARKEWADFLDDEARFLERLKERRAQQAEHFATLERQHESLGNLANELPDLIDEVARVVPVNIYYVNKLAELQLQADQNLRVGSSLMDEYRRIVHEYDTLIEKVSTDHDGHAATLRTIDVLQGNKPGSPQGGSATSSATDNVAVSPATPTHVLRSSGAADISKEVGSAVGNAAGKTSARADELRARVQAMKDHVPPAPMPSSGPMPSVSVPLDRRTPDFEYRIEQRR